MSVSGLPFKFGVNQFTTQPWTFEEDLARYRALGVEAVELCEQKLDEARFSEQMDRPARSGLPVPAVQPLVGPSGPAPCKRSR